MLAKLKSDSASNACIRLLASACFAVFSVFNHCDAQVIAPGLDQAPSNSYPNAQYYLALEIYREGDLGTAAEAFDSALGQCRKDINGRWIDAIPVHAMLAECFYQAGDLAAASEQIDMALALAIRNRGWLSALEWQDSTVAAIMTPDPASAWAGTNLPAIVPLSDKVKMGTGNADVAGQIQRGGVFESFRLTSIDAVEIMRGISIASYRRRVIYGQLSNQTEIVAQSLDATKIPSGLQLPIPRALIVAMRGCERFGGGEDAETIVDVGKAAFIGNAAHPLSAMLLLSGARAVAMTDKYVDAVPMAMQAAITASALRQPEWVGEAMLVAAGCLDNKSAGAFLASANNAAGMHLRRGRVASVGALLAACEASLLVGDTGAAQVALTQAASLLQRRDMQQPRLAAHGEYLAARAAAQTGASFGLSEPSLIDQSLARMFTFTAGNGPKLGRGGANNRRPNGNTPATPRLFQLGLVTAGARSRGVGGKVVDEKVNLYAADPTDAVWRADPVDAIAYQVFDRSQSVAAQLVSAIKRNATNELLALVDKLHRQRFLATQSLGGRVLQARRLAATENALLTEPVAAAMAKPPATLTEMVNILAMPLPLPGSPELAARGERLESLAALLALQRGELPGASPPAIVGPSDLQRLPKNTALLTFAELDGTTIAVLFAKEKIKTWNVTPTKAVAGEIVKLLRELGVSSNRSAERLGDETVWKKQSAALRRKLIPDSYLEDLESSENLVVVPDGVLWYLPFELLLLGDENADSLGDRMLIRYSPTPGLAVHPVAFPNFDRPTGLVSQLFFAPRDPEANTQMMAQVRDALKASTTLPTDPPVIGALLGESIGPLAVFGIVSPNPANPFAFSPTIYDAADPFGSLAAWGRFPSRVPRSVFLPGFRTAATSPTLGDGREIFLTLTALHCSGVRDVMLSRWAVGGESTSLLMKEFLQELSFEGIQPAWRRAIQALRESPLNPDAEPLLGAKDKEREELTGDHPLFWSGYIIDTPPEMVKK